MSVVLDLTQSGSGSTEIHAEPGDTITLELASVVSNSVLAAAIAGLQGLGKLLGVTFAINTAGGAT
jgi:hypothetical protein